MAARQNRVLLGFVQYSDKPILPYKGYQTAIGPGRNLHSLNIVQDADEVGHLLPVEAPDLCAQAVGQWLAVAVAPLLR